MIRLSFAIFLLTASAAWSQPTPHPESSAPMQTARFSFEQRWPASDPQWFQIVVLRDGAASYRSLPRRDAKSDSGDPAEESYDFTLSPRSRQFVFSLAQNLPQFQGSLDKRKVAFTGTKTLRYEDGAGHASAISYNYSSAREITAVTELMQEISESIHFLQTLQLQLRFDKLALNDTLRRIDDLATARKLMEPEVLAPMLTKIADNPSVMNIARQRARHILETQPAENAK